MTDLGQWADAVAIAKTLLGIGLAVGFIAALIHS